MSFDLFIQGIIQFGVPVMISGLVLYFIYITGNVLVEYLKSSLIPEKIQKNQENLLSAVIREDINIKEKMLKLLYKLNADRILIFFYHNGGSGFHGIGKTKVSVISEVLSYGTSSVIQELNNLPISFTYMWNQKIIENDRFILKNIEDLKETDVSMYNHLKEKEVKSMYAIGWYTENGMPKGFLNISFCKSFKSLSTQEIEEIEKFAYSLK